MLKSASAGTLESGDIYIEVSPIIEHKIDVKLTSIVAQQFGKRIKQIIIDEIAKRDLNGISVNVVDKGARDCTVKARINAVLNRAMDTEVIKWD
ncbi:MAG: citrate lyase acyl carrier protein [Clostridia bacterium]|nr:citrate lyase acyl carrier protein [Clostridia bacterium]